MSECKSAGIEKLPRLPDCIEILEAECIRRDVVIDGNRTVIRQWGSGKPLVLFHGGHGSWLHWLRNIRALARERTLYLVDLPGFGDSDTILYKDMATYSEPIAKAVETLLPEGRFALGGFSFGSSVAAYCLRTLSSRVERLIMVGSPILSEKVDFVRDQMVRWRNIKDPASLVQAHSNNLQVLMLRPNANISQNTAMIQHAMTTRARLRYQPGKAGPPAREILRQLRPDIIAIWGEDDVLVRNHFQSAKDLIDSLESGSQMHIVPDAGHWVQYEQDEIVTNLILKSLET